MSHTGELIIVGISERNRLLLKDRLKFKDKRKMGHKEIQCNRVERTELARDRVR
jgi:hypothetical protein